MPKDEITALVALSVVAECIDVVELSVAIPVVTSATALVAAEVLPSVTLSIVEVTADELSFNFPLVDVHEDGVVASCKVLENG